MELDQVFSQPEAEEESSIDVNLLLQPDGAVDESQVNDTNWNVEPPNIQADAVIEEPITSDAPEVDTPIVRQEAPIDQGYKYNPVWDLLKSKLSTEEQEFDLPDAIKTGKIGEQDIDSEYELQLLVDTINQHVYRPELEDPFVQSYLRAKDSEGFKLNEWVKSQFSRNDVLELGDKDFMREYLYMELGKNDQNPDGMTREEINSHVEALERNGLLEFQARQNKRTYRQQLEKETRLNQDALIRQKEEELAIARSNAEKQVNMLFQRKNAQDKIMGLPFGKAEKEGYNKWFQELVMPSDKGSKLNQLLRNDDLLYEMLYPVYIGRSGIKDLITSTKESVKEELRGKLGVKPNIAPQGGKPEVYTVDVNKLKLPEGY